MGITKSELFKKRQNRIALIGTAFAHPARVAILEYLLHNKTWICNLSRRHTAAFTVNDHTTLESPEKGGNY